MKFFIAIMAFGFMNSEVQANDKLERVLNGRVYCKELSQTLDAGENHRKTSFVLNCLNRTIDTVNTDGDIKSIEFLKAVCNDNSIFYQSSVRSCFEKVFIGSPLEAHFIDVNHRCEKVWYEGKYRSCMTRNL